MHNESQEEVDMTLRYVADRNSLNDQILTLRRRNAALQADYERAMDQLEQMREERNALFQENMQLRLQFSAYVIAGG